MSTRGCVAVGNLVKWRGIYNHYDSYPSELGVAVYEHVMRQLLEGKTLAEIGESILHFDDWRNYLDGGVCKYCGKFAGQPHSIRGDIAVASDVNPGKYPDPEAKYHEHNDISSPKAIRANHITNQDSDPLFIEWVYIIDPEAEAIHVLKHVACPKVKLKKPLELNPDGTTKEYVRRLSGGRFHYGHCVYRHQHVGSLTFNAKPDWDVIECGELFEHCNHYAYRHFPELQGTPSENLATTDYASHRPLPKEFENAVAYLIRGTLYWKGGCGFMGCQALGRASGNTDPNFWYQSLKHTFGGKDRQQREVAVARISPDRASRRTPAPGVVWLFPPTLHHGWSASSELSAKQWEQVNKELLVSVK